MSATDRFDSLTVEVKAQELRSESLYLDCRYRARMHIAKAKLYRAQGRSCKAKMYLNRALDWHDLSLQVPRAARPVPEEQPQ